MRVTITVQMDNAAFDPPEVEVARILRGVAQDLDDGRPAASRCRLLPDRWALDTTPRLTMMPDYNSPVTRVDFDCIANATSFGIALDRLRIDYTAELRGPRLVFSNFRTHSVRPDIPPRTIGPETIRRLADVHGGTPV